MSAIVRKKTKNSNSYRALTVLVIFAFVNSIFMPIVSVYGQSALPVSAPLVTSSPQFTPTLIKGVTVDPQNPFRFNFIVDKGESGLEGDLLKEESNKLIKYFMASMTTPEEDLWVNLSPYEKDRIIADEFAKTDMGRDLLAQDYLLKQLTSSLTNPNDELGKKFWDNIHKQAYEKFGTTQMPVDTFNKVWIVPEAADVYQNGNTAFVAQSRLKVMLEQDYEAMANKRGIAESRATARDAASSHQSPVTSHQVSSLEVNDSSGYSGLWTLDQSSVFREIIIPAIEQEVNEGKHFAQLRQIYNSLILASWFKVTLKETLLGQLYVNQKKVSGVDDVSPQAKEAIYEEYIDTYKKGVYNFIQEDYDQATKQVIPRKYFSGGANVSVIASQNGRMPVLNVFNSGDPSIAPPAAIRSIEGYIASLKNDSTAVSVKADLQTLQSVPAGVDVSMLSSPVNSKGETFYGALKRMVKADESHTLSNLLPGTWKVNYTPVEILEIIRHEITGVSREYFFDKRRPTYSSNSPDVDQNLNGIWHLARDVAFVDANKDYVELPKQGFHDLLLRVFADKINAHVRDEDDFDLEGEFNDNLEGARRHEMWEHLFPREIKIESFDEWIEFLTVEENASQNLFLHLQAIDKRIKGLFQEMEDYVNAESFDGKSVENPFYEDLRQLFTLKAFIWFLWNQSKPESVHFAFSKLLVTKAERFSIDRNIQEFIRSGFLKSGTYGSVSRGRNQFEVKVLYSNEKITSREMDNLNILLQTTGIEMKVKEGQKRVDAIKEFVEKFFAMKKDDLQLVGIDLDDISIKIESDRKVKVFVKDNALMVSAEAPRYLDDWLSAEDIANDYFETSAKLEHLVDIPATLRIKGSTEMPVAQEKVREFLKVIFAESPKKQFVDIRLQPKERKSPPVAFLSADAPPDSLFLPKFFRIKKGEVDDASFNNIELFSFVSSLLREGKDAVILEDRANVNYKKNGVPTRVSVKADLSYSNFTGTKVNATNFMLLNGTLVSVSEVKDNLFASNLFLETAVSISAKDVERINQSAIDAFESMNLGLAHDKRLYQGSINLDLEVDEDGNLKDLWIVNVSGEKAEARELPKEKEIPGLIMHIIENDLNDYHGHLIDMMKEERTYKDLISKLEEYLRRNGRESADKKLFLKQERAIIVLADLFFMAKKSNSLNKMPIMLVGGEAGINELLKAITLNQATAGKIHDSLAFNIPEHIRENGSAEEIYMWYINPFIEAANQREMEDFKVSRERLMKLIKMPEPGSLRFHEEADGSYKVFWSKGPARMGVSSANASDAWTFSKLIGGFTLNMGIDILEQSPVMTEVQRLDENKIILERYELEWEEDEGQDSDTDSKKGRFKILKRWEEEITHENIDQLFKVDDKLFQNKDDPLRMLKAGLVEAGIIQENSADPLADIAKFTNKGGLRFRIGSLIPEGSGFASSSTAGANILNALYHVSDQEEFTGRADYEDLLGSLTLLFENKLGLKSGRQDVEGPIYGKVNDITYKPTEDFLVGKINQLELVDDQLKDIKEHLLLVDTGIPRTKSLDIRRGLNMRSLAYLSRDPKAYLAIEKSLGLHKEIVEAFKTQNWPKLGRLFLEYMSLREQIDPTATSSQFDDINDEKVLREFDKLKEQGLIYGWMFTGAMGGGAIMLIPTAKGFEMEGNNSRIHNALEEIKAIQLEVDSQWVKDKLFVPENAEDRENKIKEKKGEIKLSDDETKVIPFRSLKMKPYSINNKGIEHGTADELRDVALLTTESARPALNHLDKWLEGKDWWQALSKERKALFQKVFVNGNLHAVPIDHHLLKEHFGIEDGTVAEAHLRAINEMSSYVDTFIINPDVMAGRYDNEENNFVSLKDLAGEDKDFVAKNYGKITLHPQLPKNKNYMIKWEANDVTVNFDVDMPKTKVEKLGVAIDEFSHIENIVGVKMMVFVDSSYPQIFPQIIKHVNMHAKAAHEAGFLVNVEGLHTANKQGKPMEEAFDLSTYEGQRQKALWEAANTLEFARHIKDAKVDFDMNKTFFPGTLAVFEGEGADNGNRLMSNDEIETNLKVLREYSGGRPMLILSGGDTDVMIEQAKMFAKHVPELVGSFSGRWTWRPMFDDPENGVSDTKQRYEDLVDATKENNIWTALGISQKEFETPPVKKIITNLRREFSMTKGKMSKISDDMLDQMNGNTSGKTDELEALDSLLMPSTGEEEGEYIAIDWGGTHLRVMLRRLTPGEKKPHNVETIKMKFTKEHLAGTAKFVFDEVAKQIAKLPLDSEKEYKMGFTFSFPVDMEKLNKATLVKLYKEWQFKGMKVANLETDEKGSEVVGFLQQALEQNGVKNVEVKAIMNDTVATQLSVPNAIIAVIYGTGFNVSVRDPKTGRIINTESGGYFSELLGQNKYDKEIYEKFRPFNFAAIEKMLSGKNIGELFRLAVKDLHEQGNIFSGKRVPSLNKKEAFDGKFISDIEGAKNLDEVVDIMRKTRKHGLKDISREDAQIVKELCKSISQRSAKLVATVLAAAVRFVDPQNTLEEYIIALDGTVYTGSPTIKKYLKQALKSLLGERAKKINIVVTEDPSGNGALRAAAVGDKSMYGGIDLNNLNLRIKRDQAGMPLPLELQDKAIMAIEGLTPVIIEITPLNAQELPLILGRQNKDSLGNPEEGLVASLF